MLVCLQVRSYKVTKWDGALRLGQLAACWETSPLPWVLHLLTHALTVIFFFGFNSVCFKVEGSTSTQSRAYRSGCCDCLCLDSVFSFFIEGLRSGKMLQTDAIRHAFCPRSVKLLFQKCRASIYLLNGSLLERYQCIPASKFSLSRLAALWVARTQGQMWGSTVL